MESVSATATASIYLLNLRDVTPEQVMAYEALLTIDERQQAARFGRWAARVRFSAGRATLRKLLGHYSGQQPSAIVLQKTKKGKLLADAGLPNFSLSHTGDWIAIALVDRLQIGVDIEIVQPIQVDMAMIRHAFDVFEAQTLALLPPEKRGVEFYRMWTLKEAYLKATGQGLTMPLPADAMLNGWHIYVFEFGDEGIGTLVLSGPAKVVISPL